MYNRYEYARRSRVNSPKVLLESKKAIVKNDTTINEEVVTEPEVSETTNEEVTTPKKRRGRRKKSDTVEVSPESEASEDEV